MYDRGSALAILRARFTFSSGNRIQVISILAILAFIQPSCLYIYVFASFLNVKAHLIPLLFPLRAPWMILDVSLAGGSSGIFFF